MKFGALIFILTISGWAQAEQIAASGMPTESEQVYDLMEIRDQAQFQYETSGLICAERQNLFTRFVRGQKPMELAVPFLRNFKHRNRIYQGEEIYLLIPATAKTGMLYRKVALKCFGNSGRTDDLKPFAKIDCVDAKKEYLVGIHSVGSRVAFGVNRLKQSPTQTNYFDCQRAREF